MDLKERPIIVGLDPGIKTGIALIDLNGNLIITKSSKNFSKSKISEFILNFGNPIIFSCDVSPLPKTVEKIAANFLAKTVFPLKSLSKEEKNKLLKNYDLKDKHERDALAAAFFAYNQFKKLFKEIDEKLSEYGLLEKSDEIKELILFKKAKNIDSAIKMVLEKPIEVKPKKFIVKKEISLETNQLKGKLKEREREILILKNYFKTLKEKIRILEKRNNELKERLKREYKVDEKVIKKKDYLINNLKIKLKESENERKKLREEFEKIESLIELIINGWLPVLVINDASKEEVKKIKNKYDLKDKWIVILSDEKFSGLKELNLVKGIICKGKLIKMAKEFDFSVINLENIDFKYHKNFGVIKIDEKIIKNAEKNGFLKWLEKYRKRFE